MHKKFLIFTIFLFFLISFVSASSYNIEFNQVDNKVLVEHKISLDSFQTISLDLPSDATSLSLNLNYTLSANKLTLFGKDMDVSYITKSYLEKSNDGYYFVSKINFNFQVDEVQIKLVLKEGYYLDKDKVFPKLSEIGTDGKQIFVLWNIKDIKAGSDMPIFVDIKSKSSGIGAWLTWILGIIVALLILYFIYDKLIKRLLRKPAKRAKKEKKAEKAPIESHLIESEKAVIKALKEADRGELWQKQLQLKTNFSKAKLSRLIRNLEARNLIEKIPFGNTNKVRLK